MKNIYYILFVCSACLFTCQEDLPFNSDPELPSWNFIDENLVTDIAASDSFSIKSSDSLFLDKPFFNEIIIKYYSPERLAFINDTIVPIYTQTKDGYHLYFLFEKKFKQFNIPSFFHLNLSFKESSGKDRDIDLTIEMFKYIHPYSTLFISKNICPVDVVIWNHEISGDDLYFIATLTDDWLTHSRFYEYNLISGELTHLFTTHLSGMIAVNERYIYYDPTHWGEHIYRFDKSTDTSHEFLYIADYGYATINDIALYNEKLYVAAQKQRRPLGDTDLLEFDFDGSLKNIIALNNKAYSISISNGLVYFLNQDIGINLYNLKDQQLVNYKFSEPDFDNSSIFGIKVYGDQLYYSDPDLSMIGIIDLRILERIYL